MTTADFGDFGDFEDLGLEDDPAELGNVEIEEVGAYHLQYADVGDVLLVGEGASVPEEWHTCDGSEHPSRDWPEFVEAMGIRSPTFRIPVPEHTRPGHRFIIKLGERS